MATGRGESPSSQQRGPGWAQLFLETRRRGWGPPTRPRAPGPDLQGWVSVLSLHTLGLPPPKMGICTSFPKIKRPPLSCGVIRSWWNPSSLSGTPPKFHNGDHITGLFLLTWSGSLRRGSVPPVPDMRPQRPQGTSTHFLNIWGFRLTESPERTSRGGRVNMKVTSLSPPKSPARPREGTPSPHMGTHKPFRLFQPPQPGTARLPAPLPALPGPRGAVSLRLGCGWPGQGEPEGSRVRKPCAAGRGPLPLCSLHPHLPVGGGWRLPTTLEGNGGGRRLLRGPPSA